ncbi:hypothetical protein CYLTODRAFT_443045 [Cylindrobasidium torrendii FP15055 ss-10]|uniref:BTB domain-containing protein n=1 Tax=Cylindrobasidium torrendii FP15055 ss-10 TaxID=1314674 RepID=A0A0D7BGV7_9AGAR|nr:hypothetical protein CYLTODRAFT_443045 [Cylindrobasidium torrendii FP15055 ss-10]
MSTTDSAKGVSARFSDPDADVLILSSDGTLFRIHNQNLSCNSCFAPPDITNSSSVGEPAHFDEPGSVLEVLFQFLYHDPPPKPLVVDGNLNHDHVVEIWRAAHKYRIGFAISAIDLALKYELDRIDENDANNFEFTKDVFRHLSNNSGADCVFDAMGRHILHLEVSVVQEFGNLRILAAFLLYRDAWVGNYYAKMGHHSGLSGHIDSPFGPGYTESRIQSCILSHSARANEVVESGTKWPG